MTAASRLRGRPRVTLAVLVAAGVSYGLMQSLVLPALPEMQRALGASDAAMGWMLTAYLVSASVATPILGRLGDRYGKRRVLVAVLVVLAAGTLLAAVSTTIAPLLAGRAIQGAGGGIFPLAFGIIRDELPEERVAHGIGVVSSLLGLGGGLGLVLAGPIIDALSYHFLFWLPLVAFVAIAIATVALIPESPVRATGRIDWGAAALLSSGLVVVLLGVSSTPQWGWGSPPTVAALGGGALLLAAWLWREARSDHPLVDVRTMRRRGVWTANVAAFLVGAAIYSGMVLLPQYVQEPEASGYGLAAPVFASGLFLVPCSIALVAVGQLTGRIVARWSSRGSLLAGCLVGTASFALLLVARAEPLEILVGSALLGLGLGLSFAALANIVVDHVEPEQTGVATGVNTVMRTLGGSFGTQLCATVLGAQVGAAGAPTPGAYDLVFGGCALAFAASFAVSLLVPRGRRAAARPGYEARPSTSRP